MRTGGWAFLGLGGEHPRPSGPHDDALKAAMIAESHSFWFCFRVNLWSLLAGHGPFDWDTFRVKLTKSEFRRFATTREWTCGGWAGLGAEGTWLFGVAGYSLPLWGKSVMRHELFHAVQDHTTGLFTKRPTPLVVVPAELAAHLWGGPLIGILALVMMKALLTSVSRLVASF